MVGVGALGVAIVLPGLVPHFPTTFLADGLGRSANGRGGSGSDVRLASSIDIARDLGSRSTDPVLRYRSTSDRLEPLRVGILDTYRRGQWQSSSDFSYVPVNGQIPGPVAGPEVPRRVERISVVDNVIGVPQVALPPGAIGAPFPAGTWNMTVQGLVQLTTPSSSYTTEFVELDPEDSQFSADLDNPTVDGNELQVDPRAQTQVRAVLDEITTDGDTPLEIARKIQGYLRSSQFTYSLELADQAADGDLSDEPLSRFLETKRGYCVQFTSAMVMLAREAGIPARMAVGFLPGTIDGDDRVVRVSDAHAWPELYFPRLGWVRFEPTPGTRSGVAPEYSLVPTDTGSTSSASPTSSTVDVVGRPVDRADPRRDRRPHRHHGRQHRQRRRAVRHAARHHHPRGAARAAGGGHRPARCLAVAATRTGRGPRRRRTGRGGVAVTAAAAAGHRVRAARRGHPAPGLPADRPRRLPHARRDRRPRTRGDHAGTGPVRTPGC